MGGVGGYGDRVEDGLSAFWQDYFFAVGAGVVEVDAGGLVSRGERGVAEVDLFGQAQELEVVLLGDGAVFPGVVDLAGGEQGEQLGGVAADVLLRDGGAEFGGESGQVVVALGEGPGDDGVVALGVGFGVGVGGLDSGLLQDLGPVGGGDLVCGL